VSNHFIASGDIIYEEKKKEGEFSGNPE